MDLRDEIRRIALELPYYGWPGATRELRDGEWRANRFFQTLDDVQGNRIDESECANETSVAGPQFFASDVSASLRMSTSESNASSAFRSLSIVAIACRLSCGDGRCRSGRSLGDFSHRRASRDKSKPGGSGTAPKHCLEDEPGPS
jgi:hypothetical protein